MSPSGFWSDPVWSKVIANFIWAMLLAVLPFILGKKKAGEFDFFKILKTNLPTWITLLVINVYFLAMVFFPNEQIVIPSVLLSLVLVVAIIKFRRTGAWESSAPASSEKKDHSMIFRLNDAQSYMLDCAWEYNYENSVRVGEQGAGTYEFKNRIVSINRTNKDGRAIVHIKRYQGGNAYQVDKDLNKSQQRVIQISFEAKVSIGTHKLRFVAKKPMVTNWIHQANKIQELKSNYWQTYTLHFYVPVDEDFVLFFEDRDVTAAPSSIQIKNLEISELIE